MNLNEEIAQYGYVVIPAVLTPEEALTIRDIHEKVVRETQLSTLLPTVFLQYPELMDAVLKEKATQAIKSIFGSNFSLFPNFTIRESVYIPWHNDAYFLPEEVIDPSSRLQFLQCAIYLQDNNEKTGGGVTLIPCSHKLDQQLVKSMLVEPAGFEKIIMSKSGDLVIWDNRVTHRSSTPNKEPDSSKLALQWTVTASEAHNDAYIEYLKERARRSLHVSDFLAKSPKSYFCDMPNVRFPDSFHTSSIDQMAHQKINFIGIQV